MLPKQLRERSICLLVVSLMLCSLLLHACGGVRSEQFRQQGETYLSLGKSAQAEEAFRKAVEADPENAQAQLGLGKALVLLRRPDDALAAFQSAIEADPSLETAYVVAANLQASAGNLEEADALARRLSEINPERGGLLLAFLQRESGRLNEAIATLETLRGKLPESVNVRVSLANAYLANGRPDDAETVLRTVLEEIDERSVPAHMELVNVHRVQGRLDEAIEELRSVSEANPERYDIKLALARAILRTGDVANAEAIARDVLSDIPESGWANYIVGRCMLEREDYAGAIPYLQTAEEALPYQAVVSGSLLAARSGRRPALETEEEAPAGKEAAAAAVAAEAGDWRAAWKDARLTDLLQHRAEIMKSANANARRALVLSAVFLNQLEMAHQMAQELPESSPVRPYAAAFRNNDLTALVPFAQVWPEEDDPEAAELRQNAYGYVLGMLGARGQAMKVLSDCLTRWPGSAVPLFNIGVMFRRARMPEFAERTLRRLVDEKPSNLQARELLFTTYMELGREEEARSVAELTFQMFPRRPAAVLDLAQAYLNTGSPSLAVEVLTRGVSAQPDDPALQIALADTLLQIGKAGQAREVLRGVKSDGLLAVRAAEIAAIAAAEQDDWGRVDSVCDTGMRERSAALAVLCAAALLRQGQGEEAAALVLPIEANIAGLDVLQAALGGPTPESPDRAAFAKAISGRPDLLALVAQGTACEAARVHTIAYEAFRNADEMAPGVPGIVVRAIGSLLRATGVEDRAGRARQLAGKYPEMAEAWLVLAEAERLFGDPAAEKAALEKAEKAAPNNPAVWMQWGRYYDARGQMQQALAAYRRYAELRPGDPVVANNIAYYILATGGDAAKALELATRAREVMGPDPNVLHTLGLAQFRTGEIEKSRVNLMTALEQRPGDPTMLLDYGIALIALGEEEAGKGHIELAMEYADQFGLAFPRREEAEKILGAS